MLFSFFALFALLLTHALLAYSPYYTVGSSFSLPTTIGNGKAVLSRDSRKVFFTNPENNTVFVYETSTSGFDWNVVQEIIPSDLSSSKALFGYALDMDADSNRLVIGAPNDDDYAGTVFVFVYNRFKNEYEQLQPKVTFHPNSNRTSMFGYGISCDERCVNFAVAINGESLTEIYTFAPALNLYLKSVSIPAGGTSVLLSGNAEYLVVSRFNQYIQAFERKNQNWISYPAIQSPGS